MENSQKEVRPGDIVIPRDGSYSMCLREGRLSHEHIACSGSQQQWLVVAVGGRYPTETVVIDSQRAVHPGEYFPTECSIGKGRDLHEWNDVMMVLQSDPDVVCFSRARFLTVVGFSTATENQEDAPSTAPDPGEGWRLIDHERDSPQEGDEEWLPVSGKWIERISHWSTIFAPHRIYRRRIAAAEPQWHDDEAPTEDQVGDKDDRWAQWEDGELVVLRGSSIREYWHDGPRRKIVAWNDQIPPQPYKPPYTPPTTWQQTAERPPTKEDASGYDQWLLCVSVKTSMGLLDVVNWENVVNNPQEYPEWIPTAALLAACRA